MWIISAATASALNYDFENVPSIGATSVTIGGQTWTLTGTMIGEPRAELGAPAVGASTPESNGYIDSGGTVSQPLGNVGGIKAPTGVTFRALSFDIWPSHDAGSTVYGGATGSAGTVGLSYQVIGKKNGSQVVSANVTDSLRSPPDADPLNQGGFWHHLDLSATSFATTDIDTVEFVLVTQPVPPGIAGTPINYIAVDNFTYTLSPTAIDLSVSTPSAASPTAGANIAYTFNAVNNTAGNPAPVNTVQMTVNMPTSSSGTTAGYVSLSVPSGWTFTAPGAGSTAPIIVTNTTAALVNGTPQGFTLTSKVDPAATGTLSESATIAFTAASGLTDGTPGNNTGTSANSSITVTATGTGTTSHTGPAPANHMRQGGTGSVTFSLLNNGPSATSGTMTVTGTLPAGLTLGAVPTGVPWNCVANTSTQFTCTSSNAIAPGTSYPALTIPVNVASNAPASVTVSGVTFGGAGMTAGTFASDTISIDAAPILSMSKTHSGTFTQGSTQAWNLVVSNTSTGATDGSTVTVTDALPAGYTIVSVAAGSGWNVSASTTTTVNATSTSTVAGGSSFSTITVNVNVPANSPTSVTNTAKVFGGGDLTHTNLGSAATGSDTVTVVQVPATINLTSGNNQTVAVNTAFPTNLSATVLDAGSVPINGATVTFTAPASGASGTFTGGTNVKTAVTNASGVATATVYTANATAGGPYNINAAVGAISNNFSETNIAGPATQMTANAGTTPQSATVNTAFTNALAVTVKDAANNPVGGVSVTFTAPSTGASGLFSNSTTTITVITNASGAASAPFTANATAGGPYTVTAAASGLTTVNFSMTNAAGAASSMTANAGTTPQSKAINTAFTNALAVTVKDAVNNPVSGVNVTFTAPGSGASGLFSNSTATITVATNASGVASAPFTANSTAGGPYTVTAAASGLTTVNFSLTNTAGAATQMTANAGTTPQSATINTAFTNALAVTVKDVGNNPVSGVNVTFTAPGSGASGLFSNSTTTITVATNASGVASAPVTANATAGGPYTATATAIGLTTVNFSLTNAAGAATQMTANAGTTPQSATINTAFTNALAVSVKDVGNNPVSGVNVTFTAPGSGASGLFSNSTATITVPTNASGVAPAPFTANTTAGGPYTVTAVSIGLTTVNFSLTNTPGAATSITVNSGDNQGTTVGTAFPASLSAVVKDTFGNPVSGVIVTFTPPGSGASGTFAAGNTAVTNASGIATATTFTANTVVGTYNVSAAAPGAGSVNFTLTNIGVAPVITTNPTSQSVTAGNNASFTAAASGNPTPTVQWQKSTNGGATFNNISSATSTTLSFTAAGGDNGNQYRAVFTNVVNTATTTAATLTVGSVNPTGTQVGTTATANRQNGLFDLTVNVQNTTIAALNGFRLHVNYSAYLAAYPSLKLYNASSPVGSSDVYIDYPYPVAINGTVPVTLSFYTSDRRFPSPFAPVLTVEALQASQSSHGYVSGIPVTNITKLANGNYLLEWNSIAGHWYRVSFSSDMTNWFDSSTPIQAGANKTQWTDSGPPFTSIAPSDPSVTGRFYIVNEIATP